MLKQTFTTPKMIMHEHFQIDRTQNASINNSRFRIDSYELQEDFVIQNSFHTWFQLSWAQKPVMQNRSNARCAFSLLHTNIQISNITISNLQRVLLFIIYIDWPNQSELATRIEDLGQNKREYDLHTWIYGGLNRVWWNLRPQLLQNLLSIQAGDSSPMTLFMRDAFAESGTSNFFWVDYGPVSRAPCYIQLVQNIKYVSYCLSLYLKRFLINGMPVDNITCIGHSMGAHICGLLRRYLRLRINKIIGE